MTEAERYVEYVRMADRLALALEHILQGADPSAYVPLLESYTAFAFSGGKHG